MVKSFDLTRELVHGRELTVFADRHHSLRELVEVSAELGDRDYLIDGDRRIIYREHAEAVWRVARYLQENGVIKGDRVAILGRNSIEWVVCFWATVSCGAIAVGLNAWWSPGEIAYAVEHSTPTMVIDDMSEIAALMAATDVEAAPPTVAIDEDDPAVILYTSGTTGQPKGATHSHRNLICLTQAQQHLAAARLPAGMTLPPSRVLNSTPLFHVSGLHSGVVACLAGGGTTIWQTGRFDPLATMATIERERATSWSTMPTTLWRVVNSGASERFDLSSMYHVGGGGAAWSPALQAGIREAFGEQVSWGVGYGLTESTGLATSAGFADLLADPTTVGTPAATVEIHIEPEAAGDGADVDAGHADDGEIWIRGPMVMLGYWKDKAATDAIIDADGWLHSGDLGRLVDGRLRLSTRRTDLILRGAENVYPAEIEGCIEGHPQVEEVAVIGLPDEEFGQVVGAVVVGKSASGVAAPEPAELTAWVAERLAYYKVPSVWIVREEPLPRTATGKVIRAKVISQIDIKPIEERV